VSTTLRAGSCVYRVVEDDPPDAGLHTWRVACVTVEKASARRVRLAKRFDGLANILFEPDALGRLFFETPLQAIQFFLTARRLEMESLERKKAEAARAIAWAAGQPGMAP
jgi:hypothetical protein